MPIPTSGAITPSDKPFLVEHVLPGGDAPGGFTPEARLLVTSALRTSGLLAHLPDAEARSLLLLLTFLTPNGHLRASVDELAGGLGTSTDKIRRRMDRLAQTPWQGQALAHRRITESGLELYSVSPALVDEREAPLPPPPVPAYASAGREAVVAQSRARYAVPRAEVERAVAAQYGIAPEESGEGEEAVARRRLYGLGVPRDQIDALLRDHPLEKVTAQLDWLPLRNANSPARFIVAAIQRDYAPPLQARTPSDALAGTQPLGMDETHTLEIPQTPEVRTTPPEDHA